MTTYPSWPSDLEFKNHSSAFSPFFVENNLYARQLSLSDLLLCQNLVDVSYVISGDAFNGDPLHREHIDMEISKVASGFEEALANKENWISKTGLLFYVAQVAFMSTDKENKPVLSSLFDRVEIPPVILKDLLQQVNLWMNIQNVRSTGHYDGFHNILSVIKGKKTIRLISPALTNEVLPKSIFSASPNHSGLSNDEFVDLCHKYQSTELYSKDVFEISVTAGQSVFIPQGFWHQIDSEPCTMALSFWFDSPLNLYLNNHILHPYLVRASIQTLLQDSSSTSNMPSIRYNDNIHITQLLSNQNLSTFSLEQFTNWLLSYFTVTPNNDQLHLSYQMRYIFSSCTLSTMMRLWPSFAKNHPNEWIRFLLDLKCQDIWRITNLWEAATDNKCVLKNTIL